MKNTASKHGFSNGPMRAPICVGCLHYVVKTITVFGFLHRQELADEATANRAVGMTTDEIIVRLRDRMAQHSTQLRKAFKQYSLGGNGRVTQKDFKKVNYIVEHFLHENSFN